jgi:TolB-like protein/DNA-binding winged helix-turn-helix (wHTH) protein/Tfp pilus assembly protein PilF
MQKIAHKTYYFADFTLDLNRGCLRRGQDEIKLRPKSFEVLKYLVENNARLIRKNELIHAVWPDTAVTDDSLVQCLKDIRHALRDEGQQIIKTVHGRGYIFDKEVSDQISGLATTYTEDTAGVQVIIEEQEGNGHVDAMEWAGEEVIAPQPSQAKFRLFAGTNKQVWVGVLGILTLAAIVAAAIYFNKPVETIDSVAVMPFVNVSGDPNTEYLSEGLSDSIIDNLSQLATLKKVIALNSVLRYKGKHLDPQAVGRELNVRAVLMGRLVQQGDSVSISTELVDVRDNRRLWGAQYNRKLANINVVQTQIAQDISEQLRLSLTGEDKKRLNKRYTEDGEAYRLYLMGQHYFRSAYAYWNQHKAKGSLEKSIEYFEQAIRRDPSYAPAYASLGETYRNLSWGGFMPPKEARQKEELAALKALQIDDTISEAYVLLANIKEMDLDWQGAEEQYRRALELDPNSVRAHENFAWYLQCHARFDEALLHLRRAQELDPLAPEISMDIAHLFNFSRQYDKAIPQYLKTIEMDPNFARVHVRLASAYQNKGMYQEAIAELKKVNAEGGQLAYAYALAGERDQAQKMLNDLKELSKQQYVSPFDFALIYKGLGDKGQAFEWLNKTFDENPYRLSMIKVNPRFDSLRSDPRFDELLRRMKLAY